MTGSCFCNPPSLFDAPAGTRFFSVLKKKMSTVNCHTCDERLPLLRCVDLPERSEEVLRYYPMCVPCITAFLDTIPVLPWLRRRELGLRGRGRGRQKSRVKKRPAQKKKTRR